MLAAFPVTAKMELASTVLPMEIPMKEILAMANSMARVK